MEKAQVLLDRIVIGACDTTPPALPIDVLFPGRTAAVAAGWIDGELVVALPTAASTDDTAPTTAEAPYLLLQVQLTRPRGEAPGAATTP